MERGKKMEFQLYDRQEVEDDQTNPKTTGFEVESQLLSHELWPQIKAFLRQLVHTEVEREIHSLFSFLPSSPRCFASPSFEAEFTIVTKLFSTVSWAQMEAILRRVVHEEIENEIQSLVAFLLSSSSKRSNQFNGQIGEALVGLRTMKQLQVALCDIMDSKHYLVENDAKKGEVHEENMEVDEQTS